MDDLLRHGRQEPDARTFRKRVSVCGTGKLPYGAAGLILFLDGYVSLSVEVVALRRILAWLGSNVLVTAILLAADLAALALGHERDGRLLATGTTIRARLGQRLAIAAALSASGLSAAGPYLAFSTGLPDVIEVTLYTVIGIAPIGWLLAESILLAPPSHADSRSLPPRRNIFGLPTEEMSPEHSSPRSSCSAPSAPQEPASSFASRSSEQHSWHQPGSCRPERAQQPRRYRWSTSGRRPRSTSRRRPTTPTTGSWKSPTRTPGSSS